MKKRSTNLKTFAVSLTFGIALLAVEAGDFGIADPNVKIPPTKGKTVVKVQNNPAFNDPDAGKHPDPHGAGLVPHDPHAPQHPIGHDPHDDPDFDPHAPQHPIGHDPDFDPDMEHDPEIIGTLPLPYPADEPGTLPVPLPQPAIDFHIDLNF